MMQFLLILNLPYADFYFVEGGDGRDHAATPTAMRWH
jgi:hypothetical protein